LPYELFYADDLVLIAETKELLMEKLRVWKENMEAKGLRVNLGKTKVMRCCEGEGKVEPSGKFPCGVCNKGVGKNSIECVGCKRWVHKACSKVKGSLNKEVNFRCPVCVDRLKGKKAEDVKDKKAEDVKVVELLQGVNLEVVHKFCYLGDMIGAGGGVEDAVRTRVRCAWGKFNLLSPMLARRGASLKVKGRIYVSYVRSVLIYGSETWPVKVEDVRRLERTEKAMLRRMCGVRLARRINSEVLYKRLGVERVEEVVRRSRLRWFGHLERMESGNWVSKCRDLKVEGQRSRGRGKKSWRECVANDMKVLKLEPEMAANRKLWWSRINGKVPTHEFMENGTQNR
jgi:hypothetical protein